LTNNIWDVASATVDIVLRRANGTTGAGKPDDSVAPTMHTSSPGNLLVTNRNVQPRQVQAGQPVTVYADMVNQGESLDSYNVALVVNGDVEQTKLGTISGRVAHRLRFTVQRNEPGRYTVDLGGKKARFTVVDGSGAGSLPISAPMTYVLLGMIMIEMILLSIALVLHLRGNPEL